MYKQMKKILFFYVFMNNYNFFSIFLCHFSIRRISILTRLLLLYRNDFHEICLKMKCYLTRMCLFFVCCMYKRTIEGGNSGGYSERGDYIVFYYEYMYVKSYIILRFLCYNVFILVFASTVGSPYYCY